MSVKLDRGYCRASVYLAFGFVLWLKGFCGGLLPTGAPIVGGEFYQNVDERSWKKYPVLTSGETFTEALHVSVLAKPPKYYDLGAFWRTVSDVVLGQELRLSYVARCSEAGVVSTLGVKFEGSGGAPAWERTNEIAGLEWRRFEHVFESPVAQAAGEAKVVLFFGHRVQSVEIADLRLESLNEPCGLSSEDLLGLMGLSLNEAVGSRRTLRDENGHCFVRLATTGGLLPHQPQLLWDWTEPVDRGDVFAGSFWMRRSPGRAAGKVQLVLQRVGRLDNDWTSTFGKVFEAGEDWELHSFAFRAGTNYNGVSGKLAQWALNFGFGNQSVDVVDLRVRNLGQTHPDSPAHRILGGFRRGVNLGNFLEGGQCPSSNRFERRDFGAIRAEGFDHVRVPVAWHQGNGSAPGFKIADCRFLRTDWIVTNALASGLGVVLDLHHFDEFRADPMGQRGRLVALWRQVARHYAGMPTNVIFELLNEPFDLPAGSEGALNLAYRDALVAIRSTGGSNTNRLVLLSPGEIERLESDPFVAHWERLETLELPEGDAYVAATVHNYDPYLFTHQGTQKDASHTNGWTEATETSTLGILFPGPPPTPVVRDPQVTETWAKDWLTAYNDRTNTGLANPSSGERIEAFAATVLRWALASGRAVYVGEFGASTNADSQSRINYARTAREVIESAGLGWAWWNWDSNFHYIRRGRDASGEAFFQPNPVGIRAALLPQSPLGPNVRPAIFSDPSSMEGISGRSIRLSVEADGTGPLQIQWLRNGASLAGASGRSLTLGPLTAALEGNYSVVVSNLAGSVTSAPAVVTVVVPPKISVNPKDARLKLGDTARFTVSAEGTPPLSYQWMRGTSALPGRTSQVLEIPNIRASDAGRYSCVVRNRAGVSESGAATLEVRLPPVFRDPAGRVFAGRELTEVIVSNRVVAGNVRFEVAAPLGLGNAEIDGFTGTFRWTPSEAQGPSSQQIAVVASDSDEPSLRATNRFTVVVSEENLAPILEPVGPQTVEATGSLAFQLVATDPDVPANRLTFTLLGGTAGLSVSPDGLVTWTPDAGQRPGTNVVAVQVGDGGVPPLTAVGEFIVVAAPDPPLIPPVIALSWVPAGNSSPARIEVHFASLRGRTYRLESSLSVGPEGWKPVETRSGDGGTLIFETEVAGAAARFYRVVVR